MADATIDWDLIVETIRAERCVLFLGPGIMLTDKNKTFWDEMVEELGINEGEDLRYFNQDDLFLYKDPIQRTRTYFKIKAFYREEVGRVKREIYEKLGRIKFNTIISIAPDTMLSQVMDSMNISYQFDFYNKTVNPGALKTPTSDQPLIYNLFGSIDEEQSMILTHNDLYDFLFAILGDHRLPDELQNSLMKAANYVFVGFSFDKWYMQLLLRLLNLHDERFSFDRYASNNKLEQSKQMFYTEQFKINFVEDNLSEFVDTLFEKCKDGGIIREEVDMGNIALHQRINKIVGDEGPIEEVIELLTTFFTEQEEEELADDVILLSSRYKRLKRKITQEVIDEKDANLESNKIRVALLEINKEVKDLEAA